MIHMQISNAAAAASSILASTPVKPSTVQYKQKQIGIREPKLFTEIIIRKDTQF